MNEKPIVRFRKRRNRIAVEVEAVEEHGTLVIVSGRRVTRFVRSGVDMGQCLGRRRVFVVGKDDWDARTAEP